MFIRKKKNPGGATCVMLLVGERKPGKKHSNLRLIKTFGSAKDEAVLAQLMQEAEAYKAHLQAISPKASTLRITSPQDIQACRFINVGFNDVYGNCFDQVFSELSLKGRDLQKLRDLLVMRIANPASKRKTAMISDLYGINSQVDSIYKLMDELTDLRIDEAKQHIFTHTRKLPKSESIDVMFYDLTTIYFETNCQDALRDFGFSKDGKCQHVQILLAAMVTKDGLPVDYEMFPGNVYEGHTLVPVINKIKTRYKVSKVVLVADSALMNKVNLCALTKENIEYIIAARIKNTTQKIQRQILDQSGYTTVFCNEEDIIKSKTISTENDTLVALHSSKRARKDAYDREEDLQRIEKYLKSTAKSQLTSRLKKPYVTVSKACKIEIDLEKLEQEKQFDGFFGLQTNQKEINPKELLTTYRGLWQIEQTFRISKSNLEIRPVFHYTTRRIKAHVLICYMALSLIRYVGFKLKQSQLEYPIDQLHMLLDRMRMAELRHKDNQLYTLLEDPPPEMATIYGALGLRAHEKFSVKGHFVVPQKS